MANSFNSAQINFKTLTCAQAKEMFVGDQWETFEESQMLELVIKNCNALTHNVKNPENPRKIIVYVDAQNGEQRIFFNVISLKDATNIATYTKAFLAIITGDAFLDDPITNIISTSVGNYTIDAWLEGAVNNDPMLILYPMALPAEKFIDDVFKEINKSVDITKISTEIYNLTKSTVDNFIENPENLIIPFAKDQLEIVGNSLNYTVNLLNDVGEFVENTIQKVMPFTPISFKQIDDIIKYPENIPQSVLDTMTQPVEVVVETVTSVVKSVTKALGLPW